jgi:deoxyribodipyrimidine photo-lyase
VVAAALHWFTSDLRLHDNAALAEAGHAGPVAGVFVLDPALLARHARATRRIAFMYACLRALEAGLDGLGSRLLVVDGDPAVELPRLATALGAHVVSYARNHEPAARAREARVTRALERDGMTVRAAEAALVQPPGAVTTGGGAYQVYGAYARAWEEVEVPPVARVPREWAPASGLAGIGRAVPEAPAGIELPPAGEDGARGRLDAFLRDRIRRYPETRDLPGLDATSRLSPHLRWGAISGAEGVRRARSALSRDPALREGVRAWTRELAWRDFFAQLLAAHPRVAREPMRPLPVRWRHDDRAFRRWQEGRTGVPLVDAGMRELRATGFMHNRPRMIVGSFLTKHLLLDWRLGEAHFMAELLDGQLSQNNGNWQWVVGTGADAQPFHRIFSPLRQGERFDPDGTYVKRWVPELAKVPTKLIHRPWTLPAMERRMLCPDYGPPLVDLDEGRARALAAFDEARARTTGKGR